MIDPIDNIEQRREIVSQKTPIKRKSEFGQFLTPSVIGRFMTSMFRPLKGKEIQLLDPGSGIGSLTTEFVRRGVEEGMNSLYSELWELDPPLIPELLMTVEGCEGLCRNHGIKFTHLLRNDDFILSQNDLFRSPTRGQFTHSILNPPYKKINSDSNHRTVLRSLGIETSNLYSGFVSLCIEMLEDGGELVGITPRSFCNGPYFRSFRELILSKTSIVRIHLFDSRTDPFKGDEVLQENVIFHLVKGESQGDVIISTSRDTSFSDLSEWVVPFEEICHPNDSQSVFHLVTDTEDDDEMRRLMGVYSHTLSDIGVSVSTGPVVDFRLRSSLHVERSEGRVPLLYPFHFEDGLVRHPSQSPKKSQFIQVNSDSERWLSPRGTYVLVRRLSSKEEKRRIIPGLLLDSEQTEELIGIENHLNYFHENKRGLSDDLGRGLSIYLGSTFVDKWIRRFSGHTQVNASDLKSLGYPSRKTLITWGTKGSVNTMSQVKIDKLVEGE